MKQPYRNAIRSKNMIKEAVFRLLASQKEFFNITVTDIVNAAGINRGTFYNHYNNVTDVIEEIEDEILEVLTEDILKLEESRDASELLNVMYAFFKKQEPVFKRLYRYANQPVIEKTKRKFYEGIEKVMPKQPKIKILFLINAMAGTYCDYLDGNIRLTLRELFDEFRRFINGFLFEDQ